MKADEFLDALRFFGEPDIKQGVEKSVVLVPYALELAKYEGETLDRAFQLMMKRRTYRNFPLLSECLTFCTEAQRAEAPVPLAPIAWSGNRRTAQQLVLDNIVVARDAARECWIHGLWDFCRVKQRGPHGGKEIDECRRGIHGLPHRTIETDAREERLKKLVFGEAA